MRPVAEGGSYSTRASTSRLKGDHSRMTTEIKCANTCICTDTGEPQLPNKKSKIQNRYLWYLWIVLISRRNQASPFLKIRVDSWVAKRIWLAHRDRDETSDFRLPGAIVADFMQTLPKRTTERDAIIKLTKRKKKQVGIIPFLVIQRSLTVLER